MYQYWIEKMSLAGTWQKIPGTETYTEDAARADLAHHRQVDAQHAGMTAFMEITRTAFRLCRMTIEVLETGY